MYSIRERPVKIYYSGKQRRHTLKSQFIVLPKAEDIVDVVVWLRRWVGF